MKKIILNSLEIDQVTLLIDRWKMDVSEVLPSVDDYADQVLLIAANQRLKSASYQSKMLGFIATPHNLRLVTDAVRDAVTCIKRTKYDIKSEPQLNILLEGFRMEIEK